MKVCAICGSVCNDVAPTCPNCGEASWSSVTVEKPLAVGKTHDGAIPSGSTISVAADQLTQPIAGTVGSGDAVAHSARPEPQSFQRRDDRNHNRGRR